jgi:hypothetical protein
MKDYEANFQVTDASERKIRIIRFDHVNDQWCDDKQPVWVKRSEYAKAYHEGRVKRAINSIPVVEI